MYSAELFNSKKQFDKPANLINLSFLRIYISRPTMAWPIRNVRLNFEISHTKRLIDIDKYRDENCLSIFRL